MTPQDIKILYLASSLSLCSTALLYAQPEAITCLKKWLCVCFFFFGEKRVDDARYISSWGSPSTSPPPPSNNAADLDYTRARARINDMSLTHTHCANGFFPLFRVCVCVTLFHLYFYTLGFFFFHSF